MHGWGQRLSRPEVELLGSLVGQPFDKLASVYVGDPEGAHWDVTLTAGGRRVELGWADEALPDMLIDEAIRLTVGTYGGAALAARSPLLGRLQLCDLGTIVAVDVVVAEVARGELDPQLTEAERDRQLRLPPIDVGVRIETDRGRRVCVSTCVNVAFIEVTTDGSLPRAVADIATLEPVAERLRAPGSGAGRPPGDLP